MFNLKLIHFLKWSHKFFCQLKIYNYLCNDDSSIHSRIYDIYTKGVYSKRFVLDESKLRNFQVQSTNIATVDVLGMCIYAHPLLLIWHLANVYVSNIGIGGWCAFTYRRGPCVARSTVLGNAKASIRRTSNENGSHAFFIFVYNQN